MHAPLAAPASVSTSSSGYEDGLGRRVLTFDREAGGVLERLYLRPQFSAFETALRDLVQRAERATDDRIVAPLAVERDAISGELVVISPVAGERLVDLLDVPADVPREDIAAPGIDVALGFLAEVLSALETLRADTGLSHGALAPSRIAFTSHGRVSLIECVFGPILQRFNLNRRRLWTDFRLITAPAAGAARFDATGDIGQAAVVALMLVLGRTFEEPDTPESLPDLLVEAVEIAQIRGSVSFAIGLQRFLQRALPLPGRRPYPSLEAALADVRDVASHIGFEPCLEALAVFGRQNVGFLEASWLASQAAGEEDADGDLQALPLGVAVAAPEPVAVPEPEPIIEPEPTIELAPEIEPDLAIEPEYAVEPEPTVERKPAPASAPPVIEPVFAPPVFAPPVVAPPVAPPTPLVSTTPVIDFGPPPAPPIRVMTPPPVLPQPVFAPLPSAAAAGTPYSPPPVPAPVAPAAVPLRVKAEPPAGYAPPAPRYDRKLFQAAPAPQPAPWKLMAAAALVIAAGGAALFTYWPDRPLTAAAVAKPAAAPTPPPAAAPAATAATGTIEVQTQPAGARVLLDGDVVGESPVRIGDVAPGRHTLTFITATATIKRTVRVEAGKTVNLDVPVFSGWVAVFAPIVLDVSENGAALGTTEQGRLLLPPGRHTLTFTNREFGYTSTHVVEIQAGEVRSLNIEPTGTVSLNALPWAEVWIDGKKAGDTPIANLQVPLGSHEIVFKHPQFGERKVSATVIASAPSAISVDFSR